MAVLRAPIVAHLFSFTFGLSMQNVCVCVCVCVLLTPALEFVKESSIYNAVRLQLRRACLPRMSALRNRVWFNFACRVRCSRSSAVLHRILPYNKVSSMP